MSTHSAAGEDLGRRARNRIRREQGYLRAAMAIAARDGLAGLTMQSLAAEVDSAVGTVYTYFPSKGALFAEMQREAIERLVASYHLTRDRSEVLLAEWTDERAVAVARLAVFGHFWIVAADDLPHEARLLHALVAEADQLVPDEEQSRVMPAALALLGEAEDCVDAARSVRAIDVEDSMNAVVRWAAALTGALMAGSLAHLNPIAFDGPRLARNLQADLLLGWGARRADVEAAGGHVTDLESAGTLAPTP
ncbi:MAG: helix-turn-helix transcriptional regulator [Acidimicrobiales bacterium]|nr:helix-turn-helix transcriptional regulator [Acidimicrobiales bacterium]